MTTKATTTHKRKLSELDEDEDINSSSPPRQKMRLEVPDLAEQNQSHKSSERAIEFEDNIMNDALVFPELPAEMWLEILASLPVDSLTPIPFVCQAWYQLSKHQKLSWWYIKESFFLKQDKMHSMNPHNVLPTTPLYMEFDCAQDFGYFSVLKSCFYKIITTNGVLRAYVNFNQSFHFEPTNEYYKYEISMLEPEDDCFKYQVDIAVNIRMVEKVVAAGQITTNALYALAHQARGYIKENTYDIFIATKPSTPKVPSTITKQHDIISDVKLHQYQLDAINWMTCIEREQKIFTIKQVLYIPKSDLLISIDDLKFIKSDKVDYHTLAFTCDGGILADEAGLGNEVEVIGLIVSNPPKELPAKTPYFATKATLIMCARCAMKHWSDELTKYCGDKLRVIEIPTIKQVRKWTYQDILDADVVIMSYDLLFTAHFFAHPDRLQFGVDRRENTAQREQRLQRLLEVRRDIPPNKIKGIIIEHFHWHRMVVDEYHAMGMQYLLDYKRTHSWCVSSTPVMTEYVTEFIGLQPVSVDDQKTTEKYDAIYYPESRIYKNKLKEKLVLEQFFWRNTKESV